MLYTCRFCNAEMISFDCPCINRLNNKNLWRQNPRRKIERTPVRVKGRIYFGDIPQIKKPLKKKSRK